MCQRVSRNRGGSNDNGITADRGGDRRVMLNCLPTAIWILVNKESFVKRPHNEFVKSE